MACSKEIWIVINFAPQIVFDFLCAQSKIEKFTIKYVDYAGWAIYLKGRISIFSWGENIVISVYDGMDGNTVLKIFSESDVSTTLIDWGRSRKNVEKISHYINAAFVHPDV